MKKTLFLIVASCALAACQTRPAPVQECPSCDPPTRHFEVVTKCTNYKEKDLGNGTYSQCRYCTNRIYSNGVDVTDTFRNAGKKVVVPQKTVQPNTQSAKHPCMQM